MKQPFYRPPFHLAIQFLLAFILVAGLLIPGVISAAPLARRNPGGMQVPVAQGSEPQTPTPTRAIIIVLPSPTSTSGSIAIKPSNTPAGSSVQRPTRTPTQLPIVVANTATPTAPPTPIRPSPTPSVTAGITPTETRQPTKTATVDGLPAGGVELQGGEDPPVPADPDPGRPDSGRRKFLSLLGMGITGVLGAGLLWFWRLRPGRNSGSTGQTYEPLRFLKRIDKTSSTRGGGHAKWIEIHSVSHGGSSGTSPRLAQYCVSGAHAPAGFSGIHFSYERLGDRAGMTAQENQSAFEFIHQRLPRQHGKESRMNYNFQGTDAPGGAGVEVPGWDVKNKPPVSEIGDQVGQFNFWVEIEEAGGSSGGQGGESGPLVSPHGEMLALRVGLAGHTGMSAGQVDRLYRAMGEQISAHLPASLRRSQILWKLVPV